MFVVGGRCVAGAVEERIGLLARCVVEASSHDYDNDFCTAW